MFLDKISRIELELTTLCNARCPMCSRQIEGTTTPDALVPSWSITVTQAKRLATFIPRCTLMLSGNFGDPLANPDALEIIKILSPHVRDIWIDTNASLKTTGFWKNLAEIENVNVAFSIDGLADTNHLYRVNTNFDKIMHNAKTFIDAGGKAFWKFIAFKHNEHQIEQARELANSMGFQDFSVTHSKRWYEHTVIVDGVELLPSSQAEVPSFKHVYKFSGKISCKSQTQQALFISADFKLLPCCFFNVDRVKYKEKFDSYWNYECDLEKYTIEELLNTEYYSTLLPDSFSNGNAYYLCKKICDGDKNYWERKDRYIIK